VEYATKSKNKLEEIAKASFLYFSIFGFLLLIRLEFCLTEALLMYIEDLKCFAVEINFNVI
jgi:hypothetical protein